jgi:hypothetical protein
MTRSGTGGHHRFFATPGAIQYGIFVLDLKLM